MAGIIAGASGQNAFGNISQAAQAAKQALRNANAGAAAGAEGGGDLEGRVSALEGAAGSAGGGEVAGAAGMSAEALGSARGMFGSIGNRQSSVGRGLMSGLSGLNGIFGK